MGDSATDGAALAPEQPKSKRGGKREGAGRKKVGAKAPSALPDLDLKAALGAPVPDEIESLAQGKAKSAIAALVKLMMYGKSEQAKITAANKVLDRGYGKPSTDAGGFSQLSLFPVGLNVNVALANEIRDEARKYAPLAIEVLSAIADRGDNESARASAAGSLIDRGIGTVATAKVPTGVGAKPMGKKEEAAAAARNVAAGKFSTPSPPVLLGSESVQ
jgi:hypothetical protein